MIYFGVQLFHRSFHIACVSSSFIPLTFKHMKFHSWQKLESWIQSLLHDPSEESAWFFDESEFNSPSPLPRFFQTSKHCNNIYLVDHRKLIEFAHFLEDWKSFCLNYQTRKKIKAMDIPLLLASAFKIFDKDEIKLLDSPDDLPF